MPISNYGVHDVHMNQGNSGQFRKDDGVYQDGGLLIHLPDENRWTAVFLAFQSQSWHTDDRTGHTLPASVPHPSAEPGLDGNGRYAVRRGALGAVRDIKTPSPVGTWPLIRTNSGAAKLTAPSAAAPSN